MSKTIKEYLKEVDYSDDPQYVPSTFSLSFINFIKLVNGADGEENTTPVFHYKMLDKVASRKRDLINMAFRGSGKTSLLKEYMILYIAVYGGIEGFGSIPLGMYVSDSIDNGVKNMRKNLEYRRENSAFLMEYIPEVAFTDVRWQFTNIDGVKTIFKGYGAKSGVRGAKEMGKRPVIALLDDLLSDEDARSPTVIASIEDTVYKAIDYALHPTKRKIIWSGTPFNAKDPLYKAAESGAWDVSVFPVCEKFPCEKDEFRGAWEDRFNYEYVKDKYDKALKAGKIDTFNQELMLNIMSNDDRVILDEDIRWYKSSQSLIANKGAFNWYITSDLATSEKSSSDYSVEYVWALNSKGDWFLVDGVVRRQLMDKNVDYIFNYASKYRPQLVGIEVTGQQGGFIQWLQNEMINRNIFFTLASDNNSNKPGIRPNTNKFVRFSNMIPLFKAGKIYLPEDRKNEIFVAELVEELSLVSPTGFKSKHDDCLDAVSMLSSLKTWLPTEDMGIVKDSESSMWDIEDNSEENVAGISSYIV